MYQWGGRSDVGFRREINEDYIKVKWLGDKKEFLFAGIADGSGSHSQDLQPAVLVLNEIAISLDRIIESRKELFRDNIETFLSEAVYNANRILGGLKLGNNEYYAGFATSVTCMILTDSGEFTFAHAGNTRLYMLRTKNGSTSVKQLTKDNTRAQELVDGGKVPFEEYYFHPDRLNLTSGIGIFANPFVQVFSAGLKDKDVLLLSTDGIHYAIKPDAISRIIMASDSCESAAANLISGGIEMKYNDNMSAVVILYNSDNA